MHGGKMKIGNKILLGFLSISLLIGVVAQIALDINSRTLHESIIESTQAATTNIIVSIDRNIEQRIEEMHANTVADAQLRAALVASNAEFQNSGTPAQIQDYIIEKDNEWIAAPRETITPFMQELINNDLSQSLRSRIQFYKEKYGYDIYSEIFITNKYGANIAQTGKTTDYRQDDETWWQEAKLHGIHLTDVGYDDSAGVFSTDISIKIMTDDGEFLGILKAVLSIEQTINEIITTQLGHDENKILTLLNKDCLMIYSTKSFTILGNASDTCAKAMNQEHSQKHISAGIIPGSTVFPDSIITHSHSTGYGKYSGNGWMLTQELLLPLEIGEIRNLRNMLLLIILIVAVTAMLIGLLISTTISLPLNDIQNAIIDMEKGHMRKLDIKTGDELEELSKTFNNMNTEITKLTSNLEKQVKKKTEDLEKTITELEKNRLAMMNLIEDANEAYDKLKEADKEKDAYLRNIAHELKTPLTVMQLNTELLLRRAEKESDVDKSRIQILKQLQAGILRFKNSVTAILELERLKAGESKYTYEKLDINKIIKNIIARNKLLADQKNLKIVTELGKNIPQTLMDEEKMGIVLQNLIGNAIKFTEKGEIVIRSKKASDSIRVEVEDSGPGINHWDREKIFTQLFYQSDSGISRKKPGSGIGLKLAYSIIENRKGKLWVESKPGDGSTFIFTIPLAFKPKKQK